MVSNLNTLLVGICFFGIMPINMAATNQVAEIKDDILHLSVMVHRAIEFAKQLYCQRFTNDCDRFIATMTSLHKFHTPQLIKPSTVDTHDEKALNEFMVNMAVTMNTYHVLVSRVMKHEKKILCQPAIGNQKCHYPKMCNDVRNGDFAIFYCKLHVADSILKDFHYYLKKSMPDMTLPKAEMNDLTEVLHIDQLSRRIYTLIILDASLKQLNIFREVVSTF